MYKYIIEYNQNGVIIPEKAKLKKNDNATNIWHHSYSYYGSSTRAGSPNVYIHENGSIVYKTFGFTLKRINTQDNLEEILYDIVVIDDIVQNQLEIDNTSSSLIPQSLFSTITIQMEGIGEISFGIRDLYRWPGKPGEICNCVLNLN
jgi:hypothetical protein